MLKNFKSANAGGGRQKNLSLTFPYDLPQGGIID